MNAVSVNLPSDLYLAIESHAHGQGLRKSQLIRQVLEDYISQLEEKEPAIMDAAED